MATLRCTAKLLKRLGIPDPGEPPPPSNCLGDWFANIVYAPHGHYVIFVSERSFLPLFTTARDLNNLVPRFLKCLDEILNVLDVPRNLIERELAATQPLSFGRTNSRVVLGSMNDFIQLFRFMSDQEDLSLLDWSLRVGRAPCGPLEMDRPTRRTAQLLKNPHGLRVISGGRA